MTIGSMQNLLWSRKNPGITIPGILLPRSGFFLTRKAFSGEPSMLQSNKKQETIQTINHIHKRITTMQRVESFSRGMHDAQTANEVNIEEECDYESMRFLRIPIT
uniref:Uncharacterized protein n=1 Tax=Glossina pallidipes TaxID=7398 RepID=A0A1A9ZNF5_GLOPL